MENISIGCSPTEEKCVAVSSEVDYLLDMQKELERFRNRVREVCGPEPEGARLRIKQHQHDFGPYLDLECLYDESNDEAIDYAFWCEAHVPDRWTGDESEKKWGGL